MGSAIASTKPERGVDAASQARAAGEPSEVQEWRRNLGFGSLRARIFAVNIIAVIVLAIMLLYIDTVRSRLLDERTAALADQATTIAGFAADLPPSLRVASLEQRSFDRGTRLRLYDSNGQVAADNWRRPGVTRFVVDDPAQQSWRRRSARFIDRALEVVGSFQRLPPYREAVPDTAAQWSEIAALDGPGAVTRLRRAADGSFMLGAAAAVASGGTVHLTDNAGDLTRILRAERLTSFWLLLSVTGLTLWLTWYLARTIVRPLRMLAIAAHRVRLGRSREVVVPRLPERRDEIGALARALSDMSIALRLRIDATEAFAADVAHELKNPLASLRSAVDTLESVEAPALRARLLAVIRDDVGRLDRLISDIADASRLDAELSRTRFEPVDLGALAAGLVAAYHTAGLPSDLSIGYAEPGQPALVRGAPARLAQVLRNLIDNALSFSPPGGHVQVTVAADNGRVRLSVADTGPGVPRENRADVFQRFYSQRPEAEDFGRHSGLGLSIAGAIIEAHGGSIGVEDAPGGGALFTVALPATA
ncbi:sensor histidine kinase [Polymorphobacter fuscus]|uniref:histidine kinase n=1 Tax=Sandarakinorhabdus fusca TaxID=1439888 RepID=A0A7C9KP42_9SPHN|nr:sensor histidine kinase [Polymorphobacter fuscus]KAB7644937.1 HAMP domain-containing protein [Polymorphobacter fuscus]MQT18224.1 HAMP domain-containing protein [Polymorphobacter fuscus]NJC09547.1 two-component system sensor histidine kinase ChvG [Polymorphobacter fuscus]